MTPNNRNLLHCINSLVLIISFFFPMALKAEPNNKSKLQKLEHELEQQRILNNIPGMAIAVVQDNEVILLRGFGFKNIEQNHAVSERTLFPIGSVSKPFTSIITGIRVDEDVIDWNTPLSHYLSDYQFSQESEKLDITLLDALTHRSGYGRNDALWANINIPRGEIIKAAPKAVPIAPYNSEYHYNNVMYLAAGMATAHDTSFDWSKILKEKLLIPLNMTNTTADYHEISDSPEFSTGYYFDEIEQKFHILPRRNLSNIAPAGGIYSNADDLGKWLKFLLSDGFINGKQLIKSETLKYIFTPKISISDTYSYGVGWNISEYNNETLIEHSGNIEGYSAHVAILPESDIGFALLMNVSISPLQSSSVHLIFDTLLNDFHESEVNQNKEDYSKYVGDYVANFWQFKNSIFKFKVHGGKPALNIPGQTLYMLNSPDDEGKFFFEVTDNVAISFNTDENNQIISMTHHEEGEAFILPKKSSDNLETHQKKEANEALVNALFEQMNINQQKRELHKLGGLEITGTLFQEQSGVSGQFIMKVSDGLAWSIRQDYGKFGFVETSVFDSGGKNTRLRHSYQLIGEHHEQALREHPFNFLYWDKIYKRITPIDSNKGQVEVSLEGFNASPSTALVDKKTGNVEKIEMLFSDPVWGNYPRSISYADYKTFNGLNIPFKIIINDHETGKTILSVTDVICELCLQEVIGY